MPGRYLICTILIFAAQQSQAADPHRYTVSTSPDLGTISVRACFESPAPSTLVAGDRAARKYLRNPVREYKGGAEPLTLGRRSLSLSGVTAGDCIRYKVDVRKALAAPEEERVARMIGSDMSIRGGVWLWRPRHVSAENDIEIRFELPDGMQVSVPWQSAKNKRNQTIYRVGGTPIDWSIRTAFGSFDIQHIEIPGSVLRIAILDGSPQADTAMIRGWLEEAATAITTLYGRFPVPSPQVLVLPWEPAGEPVPWGQVLRGGTPSTLFVIDQRRPAKEFHADWTAAHELSHMLLPYIRQSDSWLSEGVASYYQNVLRARAGMISDDVAWKKLHAGFQRGIKGTTGNETLINTTRNMRENNNYMRVYWSGAAMALLADVKLREQTNGLHSMDTALSALRECCLPSDHLWSAREVFTKLDKLTGTRVFVDIYNEHANGRSFPDMSEAYKKLGLSVRNKSLAINKSQPYAGVRADIMNMPERVARMRQEPQAITISRSN